MNTLDIIHRIEPDPWSEADNLPWNEPGFSLRMLNEHLNQAHDAASRRVEIIDQHVQFIHRWVLGGQAGRILDMTCGPGLYLERLARLGHVCHGIDYSPAAINYARRQAERELLDCTYALSDLRVADFQVNWDLAMLIYGEFNTFRPSDVRRVLQKAYHALRPGGRLLLEPSAFEQIRQIGLQEPSWSSHNSGLFSDSPYLELSEAFWNPALKVATNRWYIVDAASSRVERYFTSYQAYTTQDYTELLASCGFEDIQIYPSLEPKKSLSANGEAGFPRPDENNLDSVNDFIAILAKKW